MNPWIIRIGIAALILAILYILEYERYYYEGAHLRPRFQSLVYDRIAPIYDKVKGDSQTNDMEMLALPLIKMLNDPPFNSTQVFLLDVATGTGRLPLALLNAQDFNGQIVGLDMSRKMLTFAAQKLIPFRDRVTLLRDSAFSLPFSDNSFDVVTCLEGLEAMPSTAVPLAEMARVLRPGGLLLTSREKKGSRPINLIVDSETFAARLHTAGFERVQESAWWEDFDLVTAWLPGTLEPTPTHELTDVLKCPKCKTTTLTHQSPSNALTCSKCNAGLVMTAEGIYVH